MVVRSFILKERTTRLRVGCAQGREHSEKVWSSWKTVERRRFIFYLSGSLGGVTVYLNFFPGMAPAILSLGRLGSAPWALWTKKSRAENRL
jgi:hypothetical protein